MSLLVNTATFGGSAKGHVITSFPFRVQMVQTFRPHVWPSRIARCSERGAKASPRGHVESRARYRNIKYFGPLNYIWRSKCKCQGTERSQLVTMTSISDAGAPSPTIRPKIFSQTINGASSAPDRKPE